MRGGDGLCGGRASDVDLITNLVSENNVTPYFLPRNNATFDSRGGRWDGMICNICSGKILMSG